MLLQASLVIETAVRGMLTCVGHCLSHGVFPPAVRSQREIAGAGRRAGLRGPAVKPIRHDLVPEALLRKMRSPTASVRVSGSRPGENTGSDL